MAIYLNLTCGSVEEKANSSNLFYVSQPRNLSEAALCLQKENLNGTQYITAAEISVLFQDKF